MIVQGFKEMSRYISFKRPTSSNVSLAHARLSQLRTRHERDCARFSTPQGGRLDSIEEAHAGHLGYRAHGYKVHRLSFAEGTIQDSPAASLSPKKTELQPYGKDRAQLQISTGDKHLPRNGDPAEFRVRQPRR